MSEYQKIKDVLEIIDNYRDGYIETISFMMIRKESENHDHCGKFLSDCQRIDELCPEWSMTKTIELVNVKLNRSLEFLLTSKSTGVTLQNYEQSNDIAIKETDKSLSYYFDQIVESEGNILEIEIIFELIENLRQRKDEREYVWNLTLDIDKKYIIDKLESDLISENSNLVNIIFFTSIKFLKKYLSDISIPSFSEKFLNEKQLVAIAVNHLNGQITGDRILIFPLQSVLQFRDEILEMGKTQSISHDIREIIEDISSFRSVIPIPPSYFKVNDIQGEIDKEIITSLSNLECLGYLEAISTSVSPIGQNDILITISGEKAITGIIKIEGGKLIVDEMLIKTNVILDSLRWLSISFSEDRIYIIRSAILQNIEKLTEINEKMDSILINAKSIYRLHIERVSSSSIDMHRDLINNLQDFVSKSADYFLSLHKELRDSIVGAIAIFTAGLFTWASSTPISIVLPIIYAAILILLIVNFIIAFIRIYEIASTYETYHLQHQRFSSFYRKYIAGMDAYDIVDDFTPEKFKSRRNRILKYLVILCFIECFTWIGFISLVRSMIS